MNAQLRRAAKACLFSTMTGLFLGPDGFALADAPGRIRHADAEEASAAEPSPLATLGEARPIPTPVQTTPNAGHKMTGGSKTKAKAKPKTAAMRPAATPASTQATTKSKAPVPVTAAAAAAKQDAENIEQTGALQGRPFATQRPAAQAALPPATQAAPQSSTGSTMSPVERELEELYRKNGRQMPEMNMQDLQVPQAESAPVQMPAQAPGQMPSQMPAGRGGNQSSSMSGYQPGTRTTKPNFFERVFGFGRSRSKSAPRTSAQQPPRTGGPAGPNGPSAYGPYVPSSTRAVSPSTPFRPTPMPAPVAAQPAPQAAAPIQRPQPLPMREPTPLGPAGVSVPQYQQPTPRSINGLTGQDGQALLDEGNARGDSESLDLSQDDETPTSRAAPQILPKQTANGSAESPYTGLKITPNESEDSIAHTEELDKAFEDELELETPAKPTVAPKAAVTKPVPSTADSSLRHPLAGGSAAGSKSAPAAPVTRKALPQSSDNELMELDDEDDEDDDDEEDSAAKPSKAPAEEPKTIPHDEKPVYRRQTAGAQPGSTPATGPAGPIGTTATGSESEKLAAAAQKGFKGFCPVILKDERRLVESRSQFKSDYRGRTYTFSSIEAKQTFDENPQNYVPARDGADVVRLAGGEEGVEGSLEHAAWYRGKLYMFSSAESRREFVDAPARFNVKE